MNTQARVALSTGFAVSYAKLALVVLVGLLIASSWLVFPYFVQGKQLLRGVGDNARLTKAGSVSRYFTRELVNNPELALQATFATNEFFQFVDRANIVANLRPDKYFIFFVSENIHEGVLAYELPDVELYVGDTKYSPQASIGPNIAEHHRITVYSFPKRDAEGHRIDIDSVANIRLHVANYYMGSERKLTFIGLWKAPYELPDDLKYSTDITVVAMLALGAGLLSSVLTPCLLQLVVMYGSVISGFATVPGTPSGPRVDVRPVIRRKVVHIALAFVLGFTLLYVLAGALIGALGHQAQLVFAQYSRMIAVVSGVVVILLGLWVGVRGSRQTVCTLPDRQLMQSMASRDIAASVITSMGFALGCTACFGGAIVATLIIYVGAIGSAAIGAGIMLTFSIGVAIPFLLAAYYVMKMESFVEVLAKKTKPVSYLSATLIICFGVILITDNFHVISDFIYPYLGLH